MNAISASDHPHTVSLRHTALAGAMLAVVLCLVFWATAAAQDLPTSVPAWVRTFQPAAGIARLVEGLFWAGVAGSILSVLLAIGYNLARVGAHQRHAH